MDVTIQKSQSAPKQGFWGGKNVSLDLTIQVRMTDEEKALAEKYFDPIITDADIRRLYEGSGDGFKVVKWNPSPVPTLADRSFSLSAHVDDGFKELGNIQGYEKAVLAALGERLSYLRGLVAWDSIQRIQL